MTPNRRRDVEKAYPVPKFVEALRRLADALEQGRRFEIRVAGERVRIAPDATISVEHERNAGQEELEFQMRWRPRSGRRRRPPKRWKR